MGLNIKKIRRKLFRRLYINTNHKIENTIFLAGSGRSGTTWLENIINYDNDFRMIFEPFHPTHTKDCKRLSYKYIRQNDNDKFLLNLASKILTGKIKNKWADNFNGKFLCNKRLIKDIRANLFLQWIKYNFPQIPIILLIRHPCAVANSRIKLKWDVTLDLYFEQKDLINDYFADYISEMKKYEGLFEKNILTWCVENYVPLTQFKQGQIYLIFYERLVQYPETEIMNMFEWLDIEYNDKVIKRIREPSEMSRTKNSTKMGKNLYTSWMDSVDGDQKLRANEILQLFGLDKIYDANTPLPVTQQFQLPLSGEE